MRPRLDQLGKLTNSFYEAAAQPLAWRSTLEHASTVFGADGACIIAFPTSRIGAVWSEGLDGLAQAFFGEGWHARNERLTRALPIRHTRPVLTESDVFSPEELDTHPFNAEFINAHDFRWSAGCFLSDVDGWTTTFTAERKQTRERFGSAETDAMAALLPHMQRAAQVASRLALAKGDGMLEAFEKMCCAALLLGCTGKVNRCNQQTAKYINKEIRIVQGCLTTSHNDSNSGLQRLLGSVLGEPGREPSGQMLTLIGRRDPMQRPLFALGMPIIGAAQDVFQQSKAMVLLIDPDAQVSPPELVLRHGFGLTPAETRLAMGIASGATISGFADKHGISPGTARFQLKAIMAKTSTHRQADLVALLARLSIIPYRDEEQKAG